MGDDTDIDDPENDDASGLGPSWAWDVAQALEDKRGNSILVPTVERALSDNDKTTLFVASTDTPDRAMDVVKQDWRLRNFRANPVILDNHMSMRVVGRALDVSVPKTGEDAGRLMIRVEWDDDSPDPTVRNVGHQHRRGIRKAGSVGFRSGKKTRRDKLDPKDRFYQEPVEVDFWWGKEKIAGWLYEQNELMEFSSATIPMNPDALQRALGVAPPDGSRGGNVSTPDPGAVHDFRQWLGEATNRSVVIDLLWPGLLDKARTDDTFRRILRAALDAAPPSPPTPTKTGPGFFARALALLES